MCLAALLDGSVREEELLARFGGEEFAVVLPETGGAAAARLAERLRQLVESHPFQYEHLQFHVTVSVGVATVLGRDNLTAAGIKSLRADA